MQTLRTSTRSGRRSTNLKLDPMTCNAVDDSTGERCGQAAHFFCALHQSGETLRQEWTSLKNRMTAQNEFFRELCFRMLQHKTSAHKGPLKMKPLHDTSGERVKTAFRVRDLASFTDEAKRYMPLLYALTDNPEAQEEDTKSRAAALAAMVTSNTSEVWFTDDHGRFALEFFDAVLQKHGERRLNELQFYIAEANEQAMQFYDDLFNRTACPNVTAVSTDIITVTPSPHKLVYMDLGATRRSMRRVLDLAANGTASMLLSYSTKQSGTKQDYLREFRDAIGDERVEEVCARYAELLTIRVKPDASASSPYSEKPITPEKETSRLSSRAKGASTVRTQLETQFEEATTTELLPDKLWMNKGSTVLHLHHGCYGASETVGSSLLEKSGYSLCAYCGHVDNAGASVVWKHENSFVLHKLRGCSGAMDFALSTLLDQDSYRMCKRCGNLETEQSQHMWRNVSSTVLHTHKGCCGASIRTARSALQQSDHSMCSKCEAMDSVESSVLWRCSSSNVLHAHRGCSGADQWVPASTLQETGFRQCTKCHGVGGVAEDEPLTPLVSDSSAEESSGGLHRRRKPPVPLLDGYKPSGTRTYQRNPKPKPVVKPKAKPVVKPKAKQVKKTSDTSCARIMTLTLALLALIAILVHMSG